MTLKIKVGRKEESLGSRGIDFQLKGRLTTPYPPYCEGGGD